MDEFWWSGQTWTYESNGVGVPVDGVDEFETLPVEGGGVARLAADASSAVIVTLIREALIRE